MKILLLSPPAQRMMNPMTLEADMLPQKTWVPLGIAYLASALRRAGFKARLRDLHDYGWEDVETLIRAEVPDVVGISCFTFTRANALRLAELAKKASPGATVVMGGAHATFFPEQMLSHRCVDAVVLGEGETTIVELARCMSELKDPAKVRGIVYRHNGRIIRTPPRPRAASLDEFAPPVYDAFDINEYKSPEIPPQYINLPGTHVITSRGCPFHCKFCSVNKFFDGKWAFRSPQNVVDEVEFLVENHGVRHIYFSDDLFTLNPERTIEICKAIIDRDIEIAWMAETRVDCVSEDVLFWMRRAGCYRVYYGVESGSPRILKSINKGFTPEQVRKAFAMTHKAGIEASCFLMVGNPGETPETISETIDLILEIRPTTLPIMGITTILPGTSQYELSKTLGLISDDYWNTDAPPPLFTGEHDEDELIQLQLQLTKGICPELYQHMCEMGFDDNFFRMRRMNNALARVRA